MEVSRHGHAGLLRHVLHRDGGGVHPWSVPDAAQPDAHPVHHVLLDHLPQDEVQAAADIRCPCHRVRCDREHWSCHAQRRGKRKQTVPLVCLLNLLPKQRPNGYVLGLQGTGFSKREDRCLIPDSMGFYLPTADWVSARTFASLARVRHAGHRFPQRSVSAQRGRVVLPGALQRLSEQEHDGAAPGLRSHQLRVQHSRVVHHQEKQCSAAQHRVRAAPPRDDDHLLTQDHGALSRENHPLHVARPRDGHPRVSHLQMATIVVKAI
mmetsp:Transcript_882/g.1390  ORF Transcript_882/g.1390 Transcript_882/m.1390 type:complete len:265 (-) Transcript_882:355-1149(-)